MPLFEVAIIQKPTKKGQEEGELERLVLPPTHIIADSDRSASMQAILQNRTTIGDETARLEVLVRPF